MTTELLSDAQVQSRIHVIRRHPVITLADLAQLYGVARNQLLAHARRFPGDFCFELEVAETLGPYGPATTRPRSNYAFTEHGSSVVAYLLATPRALAASAQLRRVFRQLRDAGLGGGTSDEACTLTKPAFPEAREFRRPLSSLSRVSTTG